MIISEQVAHSGLSLDVVKREDKALFHKFNLIIPAAYMRTDMHHTRVLEHIPFISAVDDIITIVPVAHRVYEDKQDIPGLIRSPISGAAEPEDIRFFLIGSRNRRIRQSIPYFFNRSCRNRLFFCPDAPIFTIVPSVQGGFYIRSSGQMAIDGVVRFNQLFRYRVTGSNRMSCCGNQEKKYRTYKWAQLHGTWKRVICYGGMRDFTQNWQTVQAFKSTPAFFRSECNIAAGKAIRIVEFLPGICRRVQDAGIKLKLHSGCPLDSVFCQKAA